MKNFQKNLLFLFTQSRKYGMIVQINHNILVYSVWGDEMGKMLVPEIYVKSVADIDLEALKNRGITAIILDLDNTLDSHRTKTPSPQALAFLDKLKSYGFSFCIISNGKQERVEAYLKDLPIPFVAKAGKPLKKSYKKALSILGTVPQSTAFVGDQIFTDVWGANRMGLLTVLTEPIEQYENSFFYIKRFLEHFLKSKITKE